MNLDDIRQILDLVREHDLAELEIERDGLKVRVRKAGAGSTSLPPAAPAPVAAPVRPLPAAGAGRAASRCPSKNRGRRPGRHQVADRRHVLSLARAGRAGLRRGRRRGQKGQVLCIIEAMKLMNEIESDCDGEIAAVYVENGRPVQFGDRLFAVKVA